MQMNALQRTPGMLMNALPAHCNALPTHSRYANERTPMHFRHANERTPSALPCTSHMQMSALPMHYLWAHSQRTTSSFK